MRQLLSRASGRMVLLALVALVACSEDLGPLTTSWNLMHSKMVGRTAELRDQYLGLVKALKALPAPGPADTSAQTWTAELNAALAGNDKLVADLETAVTTGAAGVQAAIQTGKVANLQKAMDDAKETYQSALSKVGESRSVIAGLFKQLRARAAEVASGASRANTKLDFTDIDFKAGKAEFLFDRPTTQGTLQRLLHFVNSCPELAVDLIGHTSNEGTPAANLKLSVARAKAVQQWLLGHGVTAKKLHSVSGTGATDNVVAEPDPQSSAAKAMPPAALEELRRKNRRVTVVVVTPCAGH